MTSVSKNLFVDKLDYIVKKYINTYHSTIKIKPFDVKSSTYIESSKKLNSKDPKIKIGDVVRSSKYKSIFAEVHTSNWYEKVQWLKTLKIKWRGHLNGEEILGTFYEKELQKTNQKEVRIEKVIKSKGDKLYAKWKKCKIFWSKFKS